MKIHLHLASSCMSCCHGNRPANSSTDTPTKYFSM